MCWIEFSWFKLSWVEFGCFELSLVELSWIVLSWVGFRWFKLGLAELSWVEFSCDFGLSAIKTLINYYKKMTILWKIHYFSDFFCQIVICSRKITILMTFSSKSDFLAKNSLIEKITIIEIFSNSDFFVLWFFSDFGSADFPLR